jgi:hypothetical protein
MYLGSGSLELSMGYSVFPSMSGSFSYFMASNACYNVSWLLSSCSLPLLSIILLNRGVWRGPYVWCVWLLVGVWLGMAWPLGPYSLYVGPVEGSSRTGDEDVVGGD